MRAIICTKYGNPDVLKIKQLPRPIPKDNEILIKIYAFPITTPDRRIRGLNVPFEKAKFVLKFLLQLKFGFIKPKNPILGNYLVGKVESVGKNITKFHIGDNIFAFSSNQRSTYAEYICLSENSIISLKPMNLTFEEAASIPYGGCNALYFLKRSGGIETGKQVLIYGASGAIGSSAIQLSKYFGAVVSGVCSSANIELVKSLGADYVIDYTKNDFTNNGIQYDIIFDAVGKITAQKCSKSLKEHGKYITVFSGDSQISIEDFSFLKNLVETNEFKPVVDSVYSFEQIADAHRYADQEHTKGTVVVTTTDKGKLK